MAIRTSFMKVINYGMPLGADGDALARTAIEGLLNLARKERLNENYLASEMALRDVFSALELKQAAQKTSPDTANAPGDDNYLSLEGAAWVELGRVQELRHQSEQVSESFSRAVKCFDRLSQNQKQTLSGQDCTDYGLALKQVAKPEEAREYLKKGEQLLKQALALNDADMSLAISLAENYMVQGDKEKAISAYLMAAVKLAFANRVDEALAELNRVLSLQPNHLVVLTMKGELLHQAGRFEDALGIFNQALERSSDPELLLNKGAALHALRKHEEALAVLDSIVPSQLAKPAYWCRLRAEALIALQRYRRALDALTEALKYEPEQAWALAKQGEILLLLDRPQEAADVLSRALIVSPEFESARRNLVEALNRLGRNAEALRHVQQLQKNSANREDPALLAKEGQLLRVLDRNQEAIEKLRQAVRLDPTQAWVFAEMGEALRCTGQYKEALDALDHALALREKFPWAWRIKGTTLRSLGRPVRAVQAFDRALELEPDSFWALGLKGQVLSDLAYYYEALEYLDKAAQLSPFQAWIHGLRGWVLQDLGEGRAQEMLDAYQKAIRLEDGENWMSEIGVADALRLLANKEAAKKKYESIIETLSPRLERDPTMLPYVGWCHYQLGEYEKAAKYFRDALEREQEIASCRFDLGLTLLSRGGSGDSRKALHEYRYGVALTDTPYDIRRRDTLHVAMEDLRQAVRARPELETLDELPYILRILKTSFERSAPNGMKLKEQKNKDNQELKEQKNKDDEERKKTAALEFAEKMIRKSSQDAPQ